MKYAILTLLPRPRSPRRDSASRIKIDTGPRHRPGSSPLFGNFAEHLGRVHLWRPYEPSSPLADERGYRKDVMKAMQGLGVTLLRCPAATSSRLQLEGRHRPARQAPVRPKAHGDRLNLIRSAPTSFSTFGTPGSSRISASMPGWDGRGRPPEGRVHQRVARHRWARQRRKNAGTSLTTSKSGVWQRDRRTLATRPQERRGLHQVRPRSRQACGASIRRSN